MSKASPPHDRTAEQAPPQPSAGSDDDVCFLDPDELESDDFAAETAVDGAQHAADRAGSHADADIEGAMQELEAAVERSDHPSTTAPDDESHTGSGESVSRPASEDDEPTADLDPKDTAQDIDDHASVSPEFRQGEDDDAPSPEPPTQQGPFDSSEDDRYSSSHDRSVDISLDDLDETLAEQVRSSEPDAFDSLDDAFADDGSDAEAAAEAEGTRDQGSGTGNHGPVPSPQPLIPREDEPESMTGATVIAATPSRAATDSAAEGPGTKDRAQVPDSQSLIADRSGLAVRRIPQPLIAFYTVFGYPMRFVPEAWRPYVDWVAISLVFWGPVTWLLARILMR